MDYQEYFRQKYEQEDPWRFGSCPFEKTRHAAMSELALLKAPRRLIDLGCGEGHFLAYLLTRAPHLEVTGVELEPAAAARCRTRLAGSRAEIIAADLLAFLAARRPQDQGAYDVAVCGDVLYFLPPETVAGTVVPAVARLLRPKGGLVLSYADVNDHDWSVQVFLGRFRSLKQLYIKPLQDPPPWPWLVALLEADG